ncbi:hypothetical protein [Catellatospora chokoriensis]|nr:hypothetical protein [Catellatospora chokoriensis]
MLERLFGPYPFGANLLDGRRAPTSESGVLLTDIDVIGNIR